MNTKIEPLSVKEVDTPDMTHLKGIESVLRVNGNRWMIAFFITLVVIVAQFFALQSAFEKAVSNKEITYVKLFPDGSWDTVEYKAQDSQLYFKTTIDHLLKRFVESRYGINSSTITSDYGEAHAFMDTNLQEDFLSSNGFDAIQKAADISQKSADRTHIVWRVNDHYDQLEGMVNGEVSRIVRSNIYFTRERTTENGKFPIQKLMLRVQWRLLPKKELENESNDFLMINPIGLKIISMSLTEEPELKEDK